MKILKNALLMIIMTVTAFAGQQAVLSNDAYEKYALIETEKETTENIPQLTTMETLSHTAVSSSVTTVDSFIVEFEKVVMDFNIDTIETAYNLLDGTTDGYQNGPHGMVVDPDGKIWIGFYYGYSRQFERSPGDTITLRGLHCFMPDGTSASFSPIEFLEFPDGLKDTIYAESYANGSCRGLTMMDNGNILWTAWGTIYKIDYQTGEGLAMWYSHMEDPSFYLSSMTEAAHDPVQNLIYVGYVGSNHPIYALDEDLNYVGKAVDNVPTLQRSIVARTKSDGVSQILLGTIWSAQGIFVYESPDPEFEKFELVDTLGNEVVVTDTQTITYMAWPKCMDWYDRDKGILLYGNATWANTYVDQGEIPESKHASKWVFLDVDDNKQLGTFGNPIQSLSSDDLPYSNIYPDRTYNPYGASFYGNSIYTIDFDLNLLQKWNLSIDESVELDLTVHDAVNSLDLSYGWSVNATDGYDDGLDRYAPPPPPSGAFDARFSKSGDDYLTDMRAPNDNDDIVWDISFKASSDNAPIVLEWDPEKLPSDGTFILRDPYGGSIVNINMRNVSSYTDTDSAPDYLQIVYSKLSVDFTSNIRSGPYPLTVQFNSIIYGNIASWSWDLDGDGTVDDTIPNPSYIYTVPGVYDVSLTVIDDNSNEYTVNKNNYITVTYIPPTSEAPSVGNGSNQNPYQIENLNHLYWITQYPTQWDKYYIQTQNINAFTTKALSVGKGWTPIGNHLIPFSGIYNGQGYIIDSLYIKRDSTDYVGLFGYVTQASILNLGLENMQISGDSSIGGIVGTAEHSIIEYCYSGGSVTGIQSLGGLVGSSKDSSTIRSCYNTSIVSGIDYIGGLIGKNYATIESSYSIGPLDGINHVGGLIAYNSPSSAVLNCFWDIETSGQSNSAEGISKTTSEMKIPSTYINAGWDFDNTWGISKVINNGYPFLQVFNEIPEAIFPILGTGSEQDPFQIEELNHLYWLSLNPSKWNKHYIQTADINAKSTNTIFNGLPPIGTSSSVFTGSYNGQGYTIDNLYINRDSTFDTGLFGNTFKADISYLGLNNVSIIGDVVVGSLVGFNYQSKINYCYSTGEIIGNSYVGGLVGCNYSSTLSDCYSNASVSGINYIGGLVGQNDYSSLISNSYCTGSVSGVDHIGGLVGYNYSNVNNSFWDTQTSGQSLSEGGTGKTSSEMKTLSTYTEAGWDFEYTWSIDDTYPFLRWQLFGVNIPKNIIPITYALEQNYPNPFNPITKIQYSLPEQSLVILTVFDISGKVIRRLINKQETAGFKAVIWNGRNDTGQIVSSGMYIYRLETNNIFKTKKMVFMK